MPCCPKVRHSNANMNEATTLGLAAVNKGRQIAVENQAVSLIGCITNNQKAIATYEASIKQEQEALAKLAGDVVTMKQVLGTEFTGTLNPNQVTIANAIKKHIDAKQEQVSLQSQGHINRMESSRTTIKGLELQIAEWRKQLAALSVDVVKAEQVVG